MHMHQHARATTHTHARVHTQRFTYLVTGATRRLLWSGFMPLLCTYIAAAEGTSEGAGLVKVFIDVGGGALPSDPLRGHFGVRV